MERTNTVPCRLSSAEDLCRMLKISKYELNTAINTGYRPFVKYKNGKARHIEAPNPELKDIQRTLKDFLQEHMSCPSYCTAGFKTQSNIKNAQRHLAKREVLTMDISHCYPNTKEKYIRNFFAENFEVSDEVLDLLMKLTTYNGYLPTGAPTSTILLCFAHKEVFDIIYKTMQKHGVDMTVYVDDITLSTHGHIGNWVIKYINNVLKRHGLFLKKAKTKRYGFRHSVITGVHTAQSRKMSAPFSVGHSVITTINGKNLAQMSITELQSIVSKISYIQQFTPGKMAVIKNKAIRQIKKLQKAKGG